MSSATALEETLPKLHFQTTEIADPGDLISLLPKPNDRQPIAVWIRNNTGMIALGSAARFEVIGQERFSRAHRWWREILQNSTIDDQVRVTGTGAFAFASFGFRAQPTASVLIVPEVIIGKTDNKIWITTTNGQDPEEVISRLKLPQIAPLAPSNVEIQEGTIPENAWRTVVESALTRIESGDLDKVVLARDLIIDTSTEIDVRYILRQLSRTFDDCWTYYVDGLVGATPEMLVRKRGVNVISRVLAGTIAQSRDQEQNAQLQAKLLASDKDQQEHDYAVESVAAALALHCTDLNIPNAPTILRLANVAHLSTEITAVVADDSPALLLAGSLHPTAAVCGTPTERARNLIAEIEGMDRGRYAGPVGWIDGKGDGDLGLAIRCAQVSGKTLRLFAGCGVVAGSTAELELAESESKFKAILNALI
jgi:menaquinone-specific isochorismate synthase